MLTSKRSSISEAEHHIHLRQWCSWENITLMEGDLSSCLGAACTHAHKNCGRYIAHKLFVQGHICRRAEFSGGTRNTWKWYRCGKTCRPSIATEAAHQRFQLGEAGWDPSSSEQHLLSSSSVSTMYEWEVIAVCGAIRVTLTHDGD